MTNTAPTLDLDAHRERMARFGECLRQMGAVTRPSHEYCQRRLAMRLVRRVAKVRQAFTEPLSATPWLIACLTHFWFRRDALCTAHEPSYASRHAELQPPTHHPADALGEPGSPWATTPWRKPNFDRFFQIPVKQPLHDTI